MKRSLAWTAVALAALTLTVMATWPSRGAAQQALPAEALAPTNLPLTVLTDKVVKTVTVGAAPFGIAFNHTGTLAYVTNGGSGTVSVINTSTYAVVATVTVGSDPQGIRTAPDGSEETGEHAKDVAGHDSHPNSPMTSTVPAAAPTNAANASA